MIEDIWYNRKISLISSLLLPVSKIFSVIAEKRKSKYSEIQYKSKIPVVIIGNISVGGTGKTPVVRKLAQSYIDQGKNPVIISRGYGAKSANNPFEVTSDTLPSQCGDEPKMLHDSLGGKVPVVISPKRVDSVRYIEDKYPDTDVIISDDGLQHYKLGRDFEVVVVDALRMFGNELCIPAGPLREPVERLRTVDSIVVIGDCSNDDLFELRKYNENIIVTNIVATRLVNIVSGESMPIDGMLNNNFTAVAGIGNPKKFINTLECNGFSGFDTMVFKDHHKFAAEDFANVSDDENIIMTYKDAVKCKLFASKNWWYLDIDLSVGIPLI